MAEGRRLGVSVTAMFSAILNIAEGNRAGVSVTVMFSAMLNIAEGNRPGVSVTVMFSATLITAGPLALTVVETVSELFDESGSGVLLKRTKLASAVPVTASCTDLWAETVPKLQVIVPTAPTAGVAQVP